MKGSNRVSGSMTKHGSFGGIDLEASPLRLSRSNLAYFSRDHLSLPSSFNLSTDYAAKTTDVSCEDCLKNNGLHQDQHYGKNSASDDDEVANEDDTIDNSVRGKKGSTWHRMKWTDAMVKLLITAVSYIGEDSMPEHGKRKLLMLQKKGKWKAISKVLGERGYRISPQQCEDKFNDLNKRYKRLTEILGRGTSCEVVENPALLNHLDCLTDGMKDAARKILSSKQLFYEEMCSYHNNNRLNLPEDPSLQHALHSALGNRDEHVTRNGQSGDVDAQRLSQESDEDGDDDEDSHAELRGNGSKRARNGNEGELGLCRANSPEFTLDMNHPFTSSSADRELAAKFSELEKTTLLIEDEMLELKQQRLKWERLSKKEDRELERMRLCIEQMKIENKRLEFEINRMELGRKFD